MHTVTTCFLLLLLVASAAASAETPLQKRAEPVQGKPDPSFLRDCAFVCVDLQPMGSDAPIADIPQGWKRAGITLEDARAAQVHARSMCMPNARRVADACRAIKRPMIFIHWGYRFPDAMDLAPVIRRSFVEQFGKDTRTWPHHIDAPESRQADELGVRKGEYVIAKSDQDAFTSSNLRFVLENLGIRNLVFVGGHAGACLGKTAESAKRLGYKMLCVVDATNDAAESRRLPNLRATGYDYMVTTDEFVAMVESAKRQTGRR